MYGFDKKIHDFQICTIKLTSHFLCSSQLLKISLLIFALLMYYQCDDHIPGKELIGELEKAEKTYFEKFLKEKFIFFTYETNKNLLT